MNDNEIEQAFRKLNDGKENKSAAGNAWLLLLMTTALLFCLWTFTLKLSVRIKAVETRLGINP